MDEQNFVCNRGETSPQQVAMNDLENMWKETAVTLFRRSQYLPIGTEYKKRKRRRVETVLVPRFRTGIAKTRRSSANLATAIMPTSGAL